MAGKLEQLQQLTDDEINRLAARKVMGWHSALMGFRDGGTVECWYWTSDAGNLTKEADWKPATDRNHSGQCLAKMVERYVQFFIWYDQTPHTAWRTPNDELTTVVPGNDARAETIAALLAAYAME